jgi:hypothetical protein
MNNKINGYRGQIEEIQGANLSAGGKFKQYKNFKGEADLHIDEYQNNDDIKGYTIRAYATDNGVNKKRVIDFGNGGFSTNGWIEYEG